MHNKIARQKGITLIEIMVALFVVAVSLMAASQAFAQWLNGSQQGRERMLARICAQNTLTAWTISSELPNVGTAQQSCEQDGLILEVHTVITQTRHQKFRRAQLRVVSSTFPDMDLATITTIIGKS